VVTENKAIGAWSPYSPSSSAKVKAWSYTSNLNTSSKNDAYFTETSSWHGA
jgi:hypothetical protein